MAESIANSLNDLAIIRALTLERVKNGLSSNVAYAYNEIINDIYSTIRSADDITIRNLRITISELMDRVNPDLEFLDSEFKDLAKIEASYTIASSNAVIGADIFSKVPPDKALENIFKTTFIEGALIAESFKDVDSRIKKALEKQMRIGVTAGENNYVLAKRIRDNIFPNKTKADVMTIARTGAATVSNKARLMTYEENNDVIKGWQYLATLDKRTSDFCKAYSHKQWDMDKKPIKHKLPYREPPYQTHWNCRSQMQPILKSFREMGIDADEIPKGTQSSLDGAISSEIDFNDWLKTKDKLFIEDILGKGRADLFRKGAITMSDLITQQGRTLTVAELKKL